MAYKFLAGMLNKPVDGFHWEDDKHWGTPRRLLVPNGEEYTQFLAEDVPPLIQTFTSLEGSNNEETELKILKFANQYGRLDARANAYHSVTCVSEAFPNWVGEIRTMRHLVDLWRLAEFEKPRAGIPQLEDYIFWDEEGVHYIEYNPQKRETILTHLKTNPPSRRPVKQTIASREKNPKVFASFPRGYLSAPALYYVSIQICTQFQPYFVQEEEYGPMLMAEYVPGWDYENATPAPTHLEPTCLLGLLWVQFQEMVTGQRIVYQCEGCKGLFERLEGGGEAVANITMKAAGSWRQGENIPCKDSQIPYLYSVT